MALLRIGLTGGIGSGKSTVATMLAARGAALIDTDAISRALTAAGGAAIAPLRAAFGEAVVAADGSLDRSHMRAMVFADAHAKQALEAILHPLIGAETARQASASSAPVRVFDVPLLVESKRWRTQVDRVWVVDCSEALQVERVAARPGWTPEAARAVVAQQATRQARRAAADAVIHNDGIDLASLEAAIDALWHEAFAITRGAGH